jgi:hypothetical protein
MALGALLLTLLFGLFAHSAASSQAAVEPTRTYVPGAFFGSQGSDPGQFNEPSQIAAAPGSSNLLVADTGNGRVQVFATDAAGEPSYLTSLGAGTVVTPAGIAVDQGTGAIYVSDSGAGKIFRFTSDGAPTPTYTLDPTFTSPTELGSYASTLAVDPITHDLLVADSGSQEIRRFDVGDGHLISTFSGSTSPGGQFTSLRGIAVAASGTIYAVDEFFPDSIYLELGAGRVESFDAAGESLGQLQGLAFPGAVGIDPNSDGVVVQQHTNIDFPPKQLAFFQGAASPSSVVNFPGSVEGGAAGIAVSQFSPFGLYALIEQGAEQFGVPGIEPFIPAEVPAAEIGPTSALDTTTAHVSGSVAPGTLSGTGTAHFEYSLDGDNWTSTPDQAGIAGPGETAVSADLADLRPNSSYSVRLTVSNDDFSDTSSTATFTTVAVPPKVTSRPVSDRGANSAVLSGSVNPFGQQTIYHFEYGATAAYGNSTPSGGAGAGYDFRSVSTALSNLAAATTYHYRLVAQNATGTTASADATFRTRVQSEPTRAYEQVTPVDKHGMTLSVIGPYQAALDGNAILYSGRSAANLPGTASSTVSVAYAALRGASGWDLRQLDVAQLINYTEAANFESTYAISADFTHAFVSGLAALTPGAVEGTRSLYRRDLATGSLELVATGMTYGEFNQVGLGQYYGGTRDFSRILFTAQASLTPEALPGFEHLYEWTTGQGLQLISKKTDGSQFSAQSAANRPPVMQFTSSDASRVYMAAYDGVYVRENGVTSLVSAPGQFTELLGVSPDGRYAVYWDFITRDVYRYDRESDTTQFVSTVGGNFTNTYLGMSADGSSIFWESENVTELYVWHGGVERQFAVSDDIYGYFRDSGTAISPNGRYFEFSSASLVDQSYDNRNTLACADGNAPNRCTEVYLYDTQEESVNCISCPGDGSRSTGQASIRSGATISRKGPLTVNDKGQTFFDTPTSLVAADSNGRRDVYEFRDGDLRLISPGTGDYEARLADVSGDGDDVFFSTEEGLVGQDTDRELDVYDARINGGISAQGAAAVAACAGADCRAPASAAPGTPATASEAIGGHGRSRAHHRAHKKGNAHHKKGKAHHKKGKAHHKKGTSKAQSRARSATSTRNFGK